MASTGRVGTLYSSDPNPGNRNTFRIVGIHPLELLFGSLDHPFTVVGHIFRKAGYTEAVGLEYFPVYPAEEGLKTLIGQLSTY